MTTPYYQDDLVTLYHGDCLEVDAWLDADVLVTDPPYGIGWKRPALPPSKDGKRGAVGVAHAGIVNDDTTEARDAALMLWGDNKPGIVFASWGRLVPNFKQMLVWQKPPNTGVIGAKVGYRRDTEAIQLIGNHTKRPAGRSSVLETKGSNTCYQDGSHPHMKPVQLLEQLIEWTSGTIADPFAGSGSTLVAARNLGRKSIGVEYEERYCEIIANRLAQGVLDFAA